MIKILFFIIIFIEIYFFNCYIVLPINILSEDNYISKYASMNDSEKEEIISRQFFSPMVTHLFLGNPPQKIYFLIKPKKNYLFLTSLNSSKIKIKEIYDLKGDYLNLYDEKNLTNLSITNCAATTATTSPPKTIADQICQLAETISFYSNLNHKKNKTEINITLARNTKDNITGIIGLNLFDDKVNNNTNFLSILNENNIIDNYQWYFDFDSLDKKTGNLIIGILPHEINKKKFKEANLYLAKINDTNNAMLFYEMKFDKIYLNNKINKSENYSFIQYNQTIEFNFESNIIEGTNQFKDELKTILFDLINENETRCYLTNFSGYEDDLLKISNNYSFYTCNKENNTMEILKKRISSLYFYSSEMNYTFEITNNQILKEIGDNIYINIIFNNNEKKSKWILGRPFIFKYQFVFDSLNGKIGFYETEKKNNDKIYKILIIITLIIYLCIGPIIVVNKYLRNNKIDDNIEKNDEEEENNLKQNIIN